MLVMLGLSLGPGLGYIVLGFLNNALAKAVIWYLLLSIVSAWGYQLYKAFDFDRMSQNTLEVWYRKTTYFYYVIFSLWSLVFILFVPYDEANLHYVAIFTQIGASVVASTLLFSDKKLFVPIISVLIFPLVFYFSLIGDWYGYILTIFSIVFYGVLYYSSSSSNKLLHKTNYQASHDQLTGLYNRNYFIDVMQQVINSLREQRGYCSLLLIDLDHFKTINDSLGHDVGDILLQEVARRMNEIVPSRCIIARMGGDEFIVVGRISHSYEECYSNSLEVSEALRSSLKAEYKIDKHNLYISASIGISILNDPDQNANQYIKEADIAMYEVKDKGRDGIVVFGDEVAKKVERNLEIERLLHLGLVKNEFQLYFQPQVDKNHSIQGCEVLLRWNSQELGWVSPAEFIPIAEKTGVIIDIGNYVIEETFKTLREWNENDIRLNQISINVSMRQFYHYAFIEDVESLSKRYLTKELISNIVFELTESVMADEIDSLVKTMNALKKNGFCFSIDDFGTGYSSLSYLRQVPLDEIKIDRSFIQELTEDANNQSMVEMILQLSKVFGLKVVAEGIETVEQENILVKSNCDLLQGYLFSKPLDKKSFESYYHDHQNNADT